MGGEESTSSAQESRAGVAPLIGQDFGVGQPGVVVDGDMDELKAAAAGALRC